MNIRSLIGSQVLVEFLMPDGVEVYDSDVATLLAVEENKYLVDYDVNQKEWLSVVKVRISPLK
jgi:hypothetical protein